MLGEWIKEERAMHKWSLKKLGERTSLSAAYLGRLENNQHKQPSMENLARIANAFEVDINTVLEAAGYLENSYAHDGETSTEESPIVTELASVAASLPPEQQQTLLDFAQFLAGRRMAPLERVIRAESRFAANAVDIPRRAAPSFEFDDIEI